MKSIQTYFRFQSYKEQIEKELLGLLKSWEEDRIEEKNDKYVPRDPGKPFGFIVSIEVYNRIREIYLCDVPFPRDTGKIFGMEIGIVKKKAHSDIILCNKKEFVELESSDNEVNQNNG